MNTLEKSITIKDIDDIPKSNYSFEYTELSTNRIKKIEKMIRKSFEYRIWILFLKNTLNLNRCAFYEGYSMSNSFTIELHHYPINLYDITYAVANKHLQEKEYFITSEVAEEVCMLHYLFYISVVPLSPSAHKLYHEGELEIHPDLVKGSWGEFLNIYNKYISSDCKEKINKMENDKEKDYKDFPKILHKNEIYIHITDDNFKSISDINLNKILVDKSIKKLKQTSREEAIKCLTN